MFELLAGAVVIYLILSGGKGAGGVAGGDVDRGPETGGRPGKGRSGTPKPSAGGVLVGTPPVGKTYEVPPDFDPDRGIWVSPDCELVVEAPGFWNGLESKPPFTELTPIPASRMMPANVPAFGDAGDASIEAPSIRDVWAQSQTAGAVGFVDYWVNQGIQPEAIATRLLQEIAPMCAQVPTASWGHGLADWYDATVRRITAQAESILEL